MAAEQWIRQGQAAYPRAPVIANTSGNLFIRMGEYAQARQAFLDALQSVQEMRPGLRYVLLNNIAYADTLLADPSLLAEADEYSLMAYKNAPWEPSVVGTRGVALVALGRVDEGVALLKKAMATHTDVESKALDACHLALAERSRGNVAEGTRYWHAARQLDPRCRLLAQETAGF